MFLLGLLDCPQPGVVKKRQVRNIKSILTKNVGKLMFCMIDNCRILKDTAENPDSTLNEDYAAPINKQEKDLLDNWIKGEWIDLNLAAEI